MFENEDVPSSYIEDYKTLHHDIGLVRRSNGLWDLWFGQDEVSKSYKDNPYFVPPLYADEKAIFTENYVYSKTCLSVFYNAYKDGKMVGRISNEEIMPHRFKVFKTSKRALPRERIILCKRQKERVKIHVNIKYSIL